VIVKKLAIKSFWTTVFMMSVVSLK